MKGGIFIMELEKNVVDNAEKKENKALKREIFDWLEIIVIALSVVILLFTFVFKVVTISGDSMLDTLHNGEKVLISNLFYTPKRGDIVVISRNEDNSIEYSNKETCIIKRVIATEGQVVDIDFRSGVVSVDGVELHEGYVYTPTNTSGDVEFPVIVPKGHIFVLGDNRNNSSDSRFTMLGNEGMVDTRNVLGRALLRVLPISEFGVLVNE